MKKNLLAVLVVIVFVSFFLPWVTAESPAVGGVTKLLTGKEQSKISSVSGFQVPILANSEESRFMISIIKIFSPDIKDADKKSWLIWAVPLLAVAMFFVDKSYGKNKWVKLGIGIIGVLIFFVAVFKIFTTDLDKLVLNVKISIGLWLLLFGYLGIGILELLDFFKMSKK